MYRIAFDFKFFITALSLVGAALFANISHADTCPEPGEITFAADVQYPSSGIYNTTGGWSSGTVNFTGLPDQLIQAAIKVNPSDVSVSCTYRNSDNNFPFSLYPPTNVQATPDLAASGNLWVTGRVWSVCTNLTLGYVNPANCPFNFVALPVENYSANPFGQAHKPQR